MTGFDVPPRAQPQRQGDIVFRVADLRPCEQGEALLVFVYILMEGPLLVYVSAGPSSSTGDDKVRTTIGREYRLL